MLISEPTISETAVSEPTVSETAVSEPTISETAVSEMRKKDIGVISGTPLQV